MIIAFAVALVFGVILAATRFGRYTYAVGSNEEAARRAGIPVDRHLIKIYALAGTLAGLAGFLSLARFSTTTLGGHDTDNLQAIAAVVIGGTSLFGGIGTMLGTRLRRLHPGRPAERLRDHRRATRSGRASPSARCSSPPSISTNCAAGPSTSGDQSQPAGGGPFPPWHAEPGSVQPVPRSSLSASRPVAATTTAAPRAVARAARPARKKNYKMTLIAGVKGDEFYITMNCGAQAKAKELGVTLDFQGPDKFDAGAADAGRQRGRGEEARRGARRADRHEGDVRADQAALRQRREGRAGRHDARAGRLRRLADRLRQRGRRQAGGQDARRAHRRQGQGVRRQRQARHLHHRPPRQGLRGGRQGGRPDLRRPAVRRRRPGQGGRDRQGRSWPRTPTSRASSPPTCSPPRAPRAASARRASWAR